jgi:hypothetical protein
MTWKTKAATCVAAVLLTASSAVPASATQTVTCYGDYCSGLDPQSSGCAGDAYTVATGYVYGTDGDSYVDIRWSPTCKTNWARANFVTSNIRAVQQTGYTQGYSANNGVNSWSRMIYSPVLCVKGAIWGSWGLTETTCV